jgi:hypothetical protein
MDVIYCIGGIAEEMIDYSYDLSSAIGQVRLFAGDTDQGGLNRTGGDRTRTDAEIARLLEQCGGDPHLAAAYLLEGKAAEYAAQASSVSQGTLRQDFRQRSVEMREMAKALRASAVTVGWNPPAYPDALWPEDKHGD